MFESASVTLIKIKEMTLSSRKFLTSFVSNVIQFLQVRGVEIGIVLLVLFVWVAAIALFFNRWGKIRMLLPYQPDYKQEQLKVPGTAACAAAIASGTACAHATGDHVCQQVRIETT